MNCCIEQLCSKDVICVENGSRVGYVCDAEIDVCDGRMTALLITPAGSGIFAKKSECFRVCWGDIVVIGDETVLVKNISPVTPPEKSPKGFFNIFSK